MEPDAGYAAGGKHIDIILPFQTGRAFFKKKSCKDMSMELTINGEQKNFADGTNLLVCMQKLNIDETATVAELNGEIISHEAFASTMLHSGDVLELLQFVGGG